MAMKQKKRFKVIYSFDPVGIPDWEDRLASVYEMLFRKVEEMETSKRLKGEKMGGKEYGGQIIP